MDGFRRYDYKFMSPDDMKRFATSLGCLDYHIQRKHSEFSLNLSIENVYKYYEVDKNDLSEEQAKDCDSLISPLKNSIFTYLAGILEGGLNDSCKQIDNIEDDLPKGLEQFRRDNGITKSIKFLKKSCNQSLFQDESLKQVLDLFFAFRNLLLHSAGKKDLFNRHKVHRIDNLEELKLIIKDSNGLYILTEEGFSIFYNLFDSLMITIAEERMKKMRS